MRIEVPPLDLLPAGTERLRLAAERGHEGDDPELPVRWVELRHDGSIVSVGIGPVSAPDGPEEHLWKRALEIG